MNRAGFLAILAASCISLPAQAQRGETIAPTVAEAVAQLRDSTGKAVGEVRLSQRSHGVVIHAELHGLPPGWHAFHVHERGACQPNFEAAGGHFNPLNAMHGWNAGGPHAGDLPNFWVADDGVARFEAATDRFSLTGVARAAPSDPGPSPVPTIFDQDGAALVVHATADDYVSEPSGGAGDRIACGEIVRK